jgi:hypothetical protein
MKLPEVTIGPATFKISPRFDGTKLLGTADTIENRIEVYEDRQRGWLLNWAVYLNDVTKDQREHAGFAVLQLAFAYFEGHAVFLRGEDSDRRSFEFFQEGVLEVFPEIGNDTNGKEVLKILWEDVRCGLFHHGITRRRIILQDGSQAFRYVQIGGGPKAVLICRHSLVSGILTHLENYLRKLRNPEEKKLRLNFQKAWKLVQG